MSVRILTIVVLIAAATRAVATPTTVTLLADDASSGDRPEGCTPAMSGGGMPAH